MLQYMSYMPDKLKKNSLLLFFYLPYPLIIFMYHLLRLVFTSDAQHHRRGSHKRIYDLVKFKNQSRKWSHKLNGIGVGRIRTFPFLPIPFMILSLMIQRKLRCRSWKQKWKNQPIAKPGIEHCHWFILPLLLATPTMQFSHDHKRPSHKQNRCSASDPVSLIFTRSYRSTLLITSLTRLYH